MMSRKHFKALAEALRVNECADPQVHRSYCVAVASVLQGSNPRFDRERFMRACGVQEG